MKFRWWAYDVYHVTLPFNAWVGDFQYLAVKRAFVDALNAKWDPAYTLVTEYEWARPHIHFVFRLPRGSNQEDVAKFVREAWKQALTKNGIPWASHRVGVQLVGKTARDIHKLMTYILKTNKSGMPICHCRPTGRWGRCDSYTSKDWCEDVDPSEIPSQPVHWKIPDCTVTKTKPVSNQEGQRLVILYPYASLKAPFQPTDRPGIWIQSLSAKQLLTLQEKYKQRDTMDTSILGFALDVLAFTLVDETGKLLFDSPEDVANHLGVSVKTFTAMADAASVISGVLEKKAPIPSPAS